MSEQHADAGTPRSDAELHQSSGVAAWDGLTPPYRTIIADLTGDSWMKRTEELLRAVVVGGQPIAEWEVCLRILTAVEGFLSELGRSGMRLDQDFPEERYQEVRYLVGAYLHADDLAVSRPYERLNAVRGIKNDPRSSDD